MNGKGKGFILSLAIFVMRNIIYKKYEIQYEYMCASLS